MIATLRGRVLSASTGSIIVDVGGVGFQIAVTSDHALSLRTGHETTIHTALIVREDELALFGFESDEAREVFDLLRGVSGVGPKTALSILGTIGVDGIAGAIAAEDDAPFRKVSGIGPKTAKLIAVSLAGKLRPGLARAAASEEESDAAADVIRALVGLGWSERVAGQTVQEVLSEAAGSHLGTDLLLRSALSRLGPRGTEVAR
ncbi:MAG: Holliday junction branch migration protein RuvA [Cryobacterium sp.]|nr:Holliday junction branch migration protein RuvA [Cryobacterium sp.]